MRNLRCVLWARENCCWLKRYTSREDEKYSSRPDTCLCVALLLQAWLSIPPKYSLQQYFIKKLPLPMPILLHNLRIYPQSTSWLHQLVDTPRHKRICASLCSFKCGGWAARPAAGHKIDAGRKKELTHCMSSFFLTGSYLSSQAASSQVLSTYKGLTTVFGMGTGGSP